MSAERQPLMNPSHGIELSWRNVAIATIAGAGSILLLANAAPARGQATALLESTRRNAMPGLQVRQGRLQMLTHWEPMPTRLGMTCCGSNGCGCGPPAKLAEEKPPTEEEIAAEEEAEQQRAAELQENPLTRWQEDSTVNSGTYEQQDESATLIYPWAHNSHAYDPRDEPDHLFDDDAPRER
jgi:hypothetical protein